MRSAKGVRQAPGAFRERRDLRPQLAVGLVAHALHAPELHVHALQGLLERPHLPREARVGELEEPCAVRVERLRGEVRDRGRQAVVERAPLDRQLCLRSGERPLELDDLLCAPAALDESGPDEQEDADRAHCEADEEGEDDHRVDER